MATPQSCLRCFTKHSPDPQSRYNQSSGSATRLQSDSTIQLDIMCFNSARTMREYSHRACTVHAPRQVFEQLPQQMVYRERGCRWYLVGSGVLPFPPGWLSMVAVISWWALDGHCPGWLLFFPYGPWMVTVFLMGHGWLPLFLNNSNTPPGYLHRAHTMRAPCPVLPLSECILSVTLSVAVLPSILYSDLHAVCGTSLLALHSRMLSLPSPCAVLPIYALPWTASSSGAPSATWLPSISSFSALPDALPCPAARWLIFFGGGGAFLVDTCLYATAHTEKWCAFS